MCGDGASVKQPLLTPAEAGDLLRVSEHSVRQWIRQKRLVAVRLPSGRLLLRGEDIDRFVESCIEGGNSEGLQVGGEAPERVVVLPDR